MKKTLLSIGFLFSLLLPNIGRAQSFSFHADTAYATVSGSSSVFNDIINNTSSPITLVWHVTATDFPADWLTSAAFGLCDNVTCYSNGTDMQLWNDTNSFAHNFTTSPYAANDTAGSFDLAINLAGATSTGTHWVTVSFYPQGSPGSSQSMTFIINKIPAAVPTIPNTDNIVLYPNPATNEVNLIYDASADVKSIAVYNIIGKIMTVYKVTDNSSANLNIDNLSSGIYFVRLMNSRGEVVVTKKFTKQ